METRLPLAASAVRTLTSVVLIAAVLLWPSIGAARSSGPTSAAAAAGDIHPAFQVESLADGVLLFRPGSAHPERTNSLVIELEAGLLVIGAQPSPPAARALLDDLSARFEAPPRFLVLPTPHADASGGAAGFPDATLIIATEGCKTALADPKFEFGAEARLRHGAAPWTAPPRVAPALVLSARTVLDDPVRPIELLPLPHAHTSGDLIVQLPEQNIVYAGAIAAMDRNPYAGDARVGGWLGSMTNISKSRPAIVVPLRGEPVSAGELRRVRDAFAWLRGEVDRGFIDGLNAERITESVLESEGFAERFDTGAKPNFLRGLVEQTVQEAVEWRRKRGIE